MKEAQKAAEESGGEVELSPVKPTKEVTEDVVYENNAADNIYDTLDDPDIGSMNPATITRI